MKNICLLGATGSIGQSTLDIIKANPDKYCLKAFSFATHLWDLSFSCYLTTKIKSETEENFLEVQWQGL